MSTTEELLSKARLVLAAQGLVTQADHQYLPLSTCRNCLLAGRATNTVQSDSDYSGGRVRRSRPIHCCPRLPMVLCAARERSKGFQEGDAHFEIQSLNAGNKYY